MVSKQTLFYHFLFLFLFLIAISSFLSPNSFASPLIYEGQSPNLPNLTHVQSVTFRALGSDGKKHDQKYRVTEGKWVSIKGENLLLPEAYEKYRQWLQGLPFIDISKNRSAYEKNSFDRVASALAHLELMNSGGVKFNIQGCSSDLSLKIEAMKKGEHPLGFQNREQFQNMRDELVHLLEEQKYTDGCLLIRGSSTSFVSENPNKNDFHQIKKQIGSGRTMTISGGELNSYHYFDKDGPCTSDIDIHLAIPSLASAIEQYSAGTSSTSASSKSDYYFPGINFVDEYINNSHQIRKGYGAVLAFLRPFVEKWEVLLGCGDDKTKSKRRKIEIVVHKKENNLKCEDGLFNYSFKKMNKVILDGARRGT